MSRIEKTVVFLKEAIGENKRILDLGTPSELSQAMTNAGFDVINTGGEDLDVNFEKYADIDVDAVTAFQIFEHMLAPFNFLRALKTPHIIASVPLSLWFTEAYWNKTEVWDRHYHEFEPKQFDMLLDRTGWDIKASEKWTSPDYKKIGFRPILRHFTKRHYIVHCTAK